ncbi:MAG: glycosyltransferase [Candidatus Paceibacterota bacterium]
MKMTPISPAKVTDRPSTVIPPAETPGKRPILLCHAYYQQRGGEDESFDAECRLLKDRGHEFETLTFDNSADAEASRLRQTLSGFWNQTTYRKVRDVLRRTGASVIHCTNLFPFASPAVYWAARREGVAVVQSLRNYRLSCVNSYLMRDGRVCDCCLGRKIAWPGILHGCYRGSHLASAAVAFQFALHRGIGTWRNRVDWYFAPTKFARDTLVKAGVPAERFSVKPNFIDPDPGPGDGSGGYALFVGRLSAEKGLSVMLSAWRKNPAAPELRIVGDGPQAGLLDQHAARDPRIRRLGRLPNCEVIEQLKHARFLIMPSVWHETFGRTIMEAFATGTPTVASRLGAMAELVEDQHNGILFSPGQDDALVRAVRQLSEAPAERYFAMRTAARESFLANYTASRNYDLLMDIYARAWEASRRHAPRRANRFAPSQNNGERLRQ